ncbi:MAG: hypothetical protein QOF77_80, partial [Solirubrobacteraceae bacterium]|nr:hypothetical protein [Solirubrobacteraceae bacterium]
SNGVVVFSYWSNTAVERRRPVVANASITYGTPSEVKGDGPSITWKCRCGALVFPLLPTRPSGSPRVILSPSLTRIDPACMCP